MSTLANKRIVSKNPVLVTCYKCKSKVDKRGTLLCAICKNNFEYDCVGTSEKLHDLKGTQKKKIWKCKSCEQKTKMSPLPSVSNVTIRNKRHSPTSDENSTSTPIFATPTNTPSQVINNSSSLQEDSHVLTVFDASDESSIPTEELLSKSVDHTIKDSISIEEMKGTINLLRLEYGILQNEFDNTSLENNDLRRQITKLINENDTLKRLCQSPLNESQGSRSAKKTNRRSIVVQPGISAIPNTKVKSDNMIIVLQQKINALESQLKLAEKEILRLNTQIKSTEHKLFISSTLCSEGLSSRCPATNDTDRPFMNYQNKRKDHCNQIHIFGTQRCAGLASALIRSRENTTYDRYAISSLVKPFSLTADIIKNIQNITVRPNDKIIICVGENDYDLKNLSINLKRILKQFMNNNVIILSLVKNEYLDVNYSNKTIRNVCTNYQNCHFVDSKYRSLVQLCKRINYTIDCIDYQNKFLNYKVLKDLISRDKNMSFKGTSLYYTPRTKSGSVTNCMVADKPKHLTQCTITNYFQKINRNNTFFRE